MPSLVAGQQQNRSCRICQRERHGRRTASMSPRTFTSSPKYIDPPTFARKPAIGVPADGRIAVTYALNLGGREDESIIDWYVCDDAQCATRREVAVSRGNVPLRQLTLLPGFADKYIEASIRPKHNISDPGPETVAISAKPVRAGEIKSLDHQSRFSELCGDAGHRLRKRDVDGAGNLDFVVRRQLRQRLRIAHCIDRARSFCIRTTSRPAT